MQSRLAGSLAQQILGISMAVFLASVAARSAGAQEAPGATAAPAGSAEDVAPQEERSSTDEAPSAAPAQPASPGSSPPHGGSHGAAGSSAKHSPLLVIPEIAGFRINGRFDVAYELGGFSVDADGEGDPKHSIKNYHHLIFLSRNRQDEWFSINAEIIDLSFYEVGLKLGDRYQVHFGKIMVPFGADPLFHKSYGGVSGVDQKLLPIVWSEHGAVFEANLYESGILSLDNELYAVSGIGGSPDEVLDLSRSSDPNKVAIGDRFRVGYGLFSGAASLYWSPYSDESPTADEYDFNMWMWGFDLSAGYGFLPWPYLDRLGLKLGFMRADIQGSDVSGLGNYYNFGDYLRVDYLLPWGMSFRYLTGMVTMGNQKGFFRDDDKTDETGDTRAHNFTLYKRYRGLTLSAQLIINMEKAGEVDNDLFRLTAAFDF
jgi:hypothetical protein